jgi:23S rRNA pseudouridine2605 synthase
MNEGIRLNKFLASCGVGSRRACDALISTGAVEINGHPCVSPGTRVGPADHVKVDGRKVAAKHTTTVILHKPRGLVCTKSDELGRATIFSLLPPALQHLNHAGRLDLDSEGLIILTNDGELSQRLMHPTKKIEKEYLVTANQAYDNAHLDQFARGIFTPEGKLSAKSIDRLSARRVRVILDHGAKRQIRVMFEALGYDVTKLLRVRIGGLWLGDLMPGEWQILKPEEIELLFSAPRAETKTAKQRPTKRPKN